MFFSLCISECLTYILFLLKSLTLVAGQVYWQQILWTYACSFVLFLFLLHFWRTISLFFFLSFLDLWFGVSSLILEHSQPILLWILLLSLSALLLGFLLHVCYTFCSLTVLGYSVPLKTFILFLFAFQFREFPWAYFQSYWFFPWPCPVYRWTHWRHSSLLLPCFYLLALCFCS